MLTDIEKKALALAERLRWSHWYYEDAGENTLYTSEAPLDAADLIETQAREIERLREALSELADLLASEWLMDDVAEGAYWPDSFTCQPARAALGDSHD